MSSNRIPNGENQFSEFKSTFNTAAIESLVAFANGKGGTVYIGISDAGEIKGITLGKETVAQIVNEIKSKTSPSLIPDAEVIEANGKTVLLLSVSEFPVKPVSTQGRYYKRTGNSNHLLSTSEVVDAHLQSMNSSWDFYPDMTHAIDDISLEKVYTAIEQMNREGRNITEDPLSFLLKYDLIRDGKLTNAAYLLFKKKDSAITTIELGRFQNDIIIKDSARTKADILTQIEQVLDFVKKHINKEVVIVGEAHNIPKWQYPMEAIREIVINMIVHRDYRSASDSVVKIYNDKIEFHNPGRLPENITVNDLLANTYKSTPRNKLIADFCKDLGLMEKYGSGIQRIINYFKESGLAIPVFQNISEGFMVTVTSAQQTITVGETVGETVRETVRETAQMILQAIKKDSHITRDGLSRLTGLSLRGVEWNLSQLKEKGIIERIGPNKGGYWKIVTKL